MLVTLEENMTTAIDQTKSINYIGIVSLTSRKLEINMPLFDYRALSTYGQFGVAIHLTLYSSVQQREHAMQRIILFLINDDATKVKHKGKLKIHIVCELKSYYSSVQVI